MTCSDDKRRASFDVNISSVSVLSIVFVISFLCYFNTLQAGFVYDDQRAIVTNQDLRPTTAWWRLFLHDFWGTPLTHSGSHKSYRPICVLTFRLNYLLGELDPWGYHLVNVLIHCIASSLFAYFIKLLMGTQWLMLLGGLMFAMHPIHTEAVAGVVGRADVASAIFFLLALISYHHSSKVENETNFIDLLWCMMFASLSLYTKEQGVTVLAVCVVYEILIVSRCNVTHLPSVHQKLYKTGGLFRILVLLSWTTVLVFTRLFVMGYSTPSFSSADNPAANDPNTITRFLTFAYLPFCNLCLLLYPFELSYDWSMDTIPLIDHVNRYENIFSATLYVGLFLVACMYFQQCSSCKHEQWDRDEHKETTAYSLHLMAFSFACMILPFLPATNLFFYVGFVIAERILYIPSIGFCILVLNGIQLQTKYFVRQNKVIAASTVSLLIMFFVKTWIRNYDWLSEESLYKSGLTMSPAKSWANLANIYNKQNKFQQAEEAYKIALKIRPNMGDTHYNLGLLLQHQGRYKEAIELYSTAIIYRSSLAAAYLNMGIALKTIGKTDEAYTIFQRGYNISDHGLKDPHTHHTSLTHIRDHTGRMLFESGQTREAIAVFHDALRRMPEGYDAVSIYNMLGQCFSKLRESDVAEMWYMKALALKPDHVPALLTYSKHIMERNPAGSEKLLKKALELEPNRTETLLLYSTYLRENGRTSEALHFLNSAFRVNQNDTHVLSELSIFHREMKDYKSAAMYQVLLRNLKPMDLSVRTNLGALYHILGEVNSAMVEYNEALKIDPTDQILRDNVNRLERVLLTRTPL